MMLFSCRSMLAFLFFVVMTVPGYAHLGHLGDVAGHSHWIGVGAVVVAGVLAGLVGKLKDTDVEDEQNGDLEEDSETEGTPA